MDSDWDEADEDDLNLDDVFKKLLDSFGIPTDDFEDESTMHPFGQGEEEDKIRELKKLYRELCLQYHPDKMGVHDAKMAQTWLDIQTAYQKGNLDRLKAIRAGLDLMEGKKECFLF